MLSWERGEKKDLCWRKSLQKECLHRQEETRSHENVTEESCDRINLIDQLLGMHTYICVCVYMYVCACAGVSVCLSVHEWKICKQIHPYFIPFTFTFCAVEISHSHLHSVLWKLLTYTRDDEDQQIHLHFICCDFFLLNVRNAFGNSLVFGVPVSVAEFVKKVNNRNKEKHSRGLALTDRLILAYRLFRIPHFSSVCRWPPMFAIVWKGICCL